MSDPREWSLGLARWAADLGRDLQRPIRAFGGPATLWAADVGDLVRVLRITAADAARLDATRRDLRPAEVIESLAVQGIAHLHPHSPLWPQALGVLPDPPVALFVRGDVQRTFAAVGEAPVVAVVGSRRATSQGVGFAHDLAAGLCRRGAVVVSGLAHGIDAAAHEGALAADGLTVAVLGCGVDVAYPRRHRALAGRVTQRGALVSEFWPGTIPAPWRFPARNRIVAGLASAVAVVEAGGRSGALITADFALEAGRPVLAVPGWPGAAASVGCNALLRSGAALLEGVDDVVDEVPSERWAGGGDERLRAPDGVAGRVYECLAREPLAADVVAERVGEDAAAVAAVLAVLEVEGLVVRGDGQRYRAVAAGR